MSVHRSCRLFFVLTLVLLVGLTGCSSKSKEYTPVLTSIIIFPSSASLAFGEEQQFTAAAKDQKGKTMSGVTFEWAVAPEGSGEITSDGFFTAGNKKGSVNVICTAEGKTAAAKVTVYKPEASPTPTYCLVALGEQIVDDTRRVGGTIEFIINNKLAAMQESVEEQILPYLPSVAMAVELNISDGIVWIMDYGLFWYEPGEYTWEDFESATPGEELQTGVWTLTWEDDWYYVEQTEQTVVWTSTIIRESDETTDTITYTNTNDFDQELNYELVLTYPTELWDLWDMEEDVPLELEGDLVITMEDSNLDTSTITGELQLSETVMTAYLDGEIDFQFKGSPNFLNFTGGLSVQLDEEHEDYFTGTMETADLKITGDIRASYVENANMPQEYGGIFPAGLSVDGDIQTKDEDPVILNGAFLLEIGNAASINPNFDEEKYSADNWLNGKVTFNGLIQGSKDYSVEGALTLEETAFNEYELDLAYTLDDYGVFREITIWAANEGDVLEVEINSTWGPARIVMEAAFDDGFGNAPTDLTGTVEIDGVEVGEVSLSKEGVRVDYIDDTFENF